jgi:hypothetical protein
VIGPASDPNTTELMHRTKNQNYSDLGLNLSRIIAQPEALSRYRGALICNAAPNAAPRADLLSIRASCVIAKKHALLDREVNRCQSGCGAVVSYT